MTTVEVSTLLWTVYLVTLGAILIALALVGLAAALLWNRSAQPIARSRSSRHRASARDCVDCGGPIVDRFGALMCVEPMCSMFWHRVDLPTVERVS